MRCSIFLKLLLSAGCVLSSLVYGHDASNSQPRRHALLVGCTRYPALPSAFELRGPGNDVALMRSLLVDKFNFSPEDVIVLAEASGVESLRPTKANVEREFRRLAEHAQADDQVVILLAGHGSQQPDDDPANPLDPEPDGLDEIFLPADIQAWDGRRGEVANSLSDDELRDWLVAITDRGASVWIIVDACHSGTMVRGNGVEVVRQVPAEVLFPEAVLQAARRQASPLREITRGADRDDGLSQSPAESPKWVAIYACRSSEPTVEKPMPEDSPDRQPYGLLTYTMNEILTRSTAPLTYKELAQAIAHQYAAWGRTYPVPLVEGRDRDRVVMGAEEWPNRSRLLIGFGPGQQPRVNGGSLHGLTIGSVLAVFPPAGQATADVPLGYVRVTKVRALQADVEPCEFHDLSAPRTIPDAARCRVDYVDYGRHRIRLAIDAPRDHSGRVTNELLGQLEDAIRQMASVQEALFEYTAEVDQADWLVRSKDDRMLLVPAAGWPRNLAGDVDDCVRKRGGPGRDTAELAAWVNRSATQIARARNLLSLASPPAEDGALHPLGIRVEMYRFAEADSPQGEIVPWQSGGRRLEAGEVIGFRIHNEGRSTIDVSLLFLDSGYGITTFFPPAGVVEDNRLPPGAVIDTPRARVTTSTTGLEHMLVIGVKARGAPVDFGCLEQPSLEFTRGSSDTVALDSPLGQVLQRSLYGHGQTRGLEITQIEEFTVTTVSWTTVDAQR